MSQYKAYVYESFGRTLEQIKLRTNVPFKPLKPTYVRIKVVSASINPLDWKLIENVTNFLDSVPTVESPFGVGFDVSGVVTEVGLKVQDFKIGDLVYSLAGISEAGTIADFVDIEADYTAIKPNNMSHDEAAGVPLAAITSYQGIVQHAQVKQGQRVLVLGASGGCGMMAVQFAKALGAYVFATSSFRNTDFVKSLGADQVIDYTTTKWVDVIKEHSLDAIYDCGFETNTWNVEAQKSLKPGGVFVTLGQLRDPIESPIGAKLTQMFTANSGKDLTAIAKWIEEGKVKVHLDSTYPFEKLLEAMERLLTGRVRGKIIIKVADQ